MWDIIVRGFINGAIFALIAAGLNLQYGVTKVLNIAHGEFLMLGALITAYLFHFHKVNPLISLAISGPAVLAIGILTYLLAFRRLVHMSKSSEELEALSLLACFGLMFFIGGALSRVVQTFPTLQSVSVRFLTQPVTILGQNVELSNIVAMIIAIIVNVVMYVILRFTKVGLALRATAQEPIGAQVVGINTSKAHMISFGLSVFMSALAGSLMSMIFSNLNPLTGGHYTFIALAVIVLGGVGSFVGSLLGGFLVGYVYYITAKMDAILIMPIVYAFIIIMLLIRPKGILGR